MNLFECKNKTELLAKLESRRVKAHKKIVELQEKGMFNKAFDYWRQKEPQGSVLTNG